MKLQGGPPSVLQLLLSATTKEIWHRSRVCAYDLVDGVIRLYRTVIPTEGVARGGWGAAGAHDSPESGTKDIGILPVDWCRTVPVVTIGAALEVAVEEQVAAGIG